jgi:hypothetical protein
MQLDAVVLHVSRVSALAGAFPPANANNSMGSETNHKVFDWAHIT